MEAFTITDAVVLVVVAISALLAYSRGLVREVLAILGWVLAAVAGFYFAPQAEPLVREIPYVRDLVESSCQLSLLLAFVGVFVVALIVLSIFTPLFATAVQESPLGAIDRGLGFLFGVARGLLLVIVALLVYETMNLALPEIDEAWSYGLLADASAQLKAELPSEMPGWIETRYNQFIGNCELPTQPAPALPAPAVPPATNTAPGGT